MSFLTKKEKLAFKIGFTRGKESVSNNRKRLKSNNVKKLKTYSFQAFNSNCDVFNVDVKGYSREEALKYAKKHLKKDPENKSWDVTISNAKADKNEFFRTITINRKDTIRDNWKRYYK